MEFDARMAPMRVLAGQFRRASYNLNDTSMIWRRRAQYSGERKLQYNRRDIGGCSFTSQMSRRNQRSLMVRGRAKARGPHADTIS